MAHHYTRYLGDLSGGQIIRHKLRQVYGLTDDGVRFYTFDEIAKPKRFKDGYRALLDGAGWDAGEQTALIAEANEAFRLNRAVFDDLASAVGVSRPCPRRVSARHPAASAGRMGPCGVSACHFRGT